MSCSDQTPSRKVPDAINLQIPNSQMLKSLVEVVKLLSADTNFKHVSAVLDDNAELKRQTYAKDEEIINLTEKIKNMERAKEIAYNEMFEANNREREKLAGVMKDIASLNTSIQEKNNVIAEHRQIVENLNQRLQNLDVDYEGEQQKVRQANQDIDGLQKNLKSKDVVIEELKSAGSKIKRAFTTSETRLKELEKKMASFQEKMQTDSARLLELEGYAAECFNDDETILYVTKQLIWIS
jgi:chromosome segregation ATPase